MIAERDTKEDELTALLALSAQDLWVRDLKQFDTEWSVSPPAPFPLLRLKLTSHLTHRQALLEADTINQQKSLKAAKGKGKAKPKKKSYDSDEEDSEDDFQANPKKAPAAKKPVVKKVSLRRAGVESRADCLLQQASVPLPSDDDAPAPAPAPVKKAAVKKAPVALPTSDNEEVAAPVKAAAKPKAAPKKRPTPSIDSASEDEDVMSSPKKPKKAAAVSPCPLLPRRPDR